MKRFLIWLVGLIMSLYGWTEFVGWHLMPLSFSVSLMVAGYVLILISLVRKNFCLLLGGTMLLQAFLLLFVPWNLVNGGSGQDAVTLFCTVGSALLGMVGAILAVIGLVARAIKPKDSL